MENCSTRILIIEDHTVFREVLSQWLDRREEFSVVGAVGTLDEAEAMMDKVEADLVLTDLTLGEEEALQRLPKWIKFYRKARFLVFTGTRNPLSAERAMNVGAVGVISKAEPAEKLIEALLKAREGICSVSGSYTDVGGKSRSGSILTRREEELMRELACGNTPIDIARSMGVSVKTVNRHRENIKNKLNLSSTNALIREAFRMFPTADE